MSGDGSGIEETIIQYLEFDESWSTQTVLLAKEWIRNYTLSSGGGQVNIDLTALIEALTKDIAKKNQESNANSTELEIGDDNRGIK